MVPRALLDVTAAFRLGCRWLCATPSFEDVLLNAVALEPLDLGMLGFALRKLALAS